MRSVRQPGAPQQPRIIACPAETMAMQLALPAGANFLQAIADAFAAEGIASGVLELENIPLAPMAYVMPALSKTGENAAFYSDIFRPPGITIIEHGALTFGRRDGAPFFHCHAIWKEADGRRSGGHILPDQTCLAKDTTVEALGIKGAVFESQYDPETNFTLFGPVASGMVPARVDGYAIRLRPNQDFCSALEQFCTDKGIRHARLRGGVGSTIGARFSDGRSVDNFATEVFIRSGTVYVKNAHISAQVDAGLVDFTGALASGILKRGDNPVLMTFELILEILERN